MSFLVFGVTVLSSALHIMQKNLYPRWCLVAKSLTFCELMWW